VELSSVQRRTLTSLLDAQDGTVFPPTLERDLRQRIEHAIRPLMPFPEEPLRLSKERLNILGRCQGLFDADLAGEGPPFEHNEASAAGTLAHKAIELDVTLREKLDGRSLSERAAERLAADRAFGPYWRDLDSAARDEMVTRVVRSVEQFRESFPPIRPLRRLLAPVTEQWLETRFASGAVRLAGKVDLLLNAARGGRSTRVVVDLKGGRAYRDHAEDMRLYALLLLFRTGRSPYRVATFYLSSGEWQAEDVTPETLGRAADRVVLAVRVAAGLRRGRAPELTPGPWCIRCPRARICPVAALPDRAGPLPGGFGSPTLG
jgi:hypothetical protein